MAAVLFGATTPIAKALLTAVPPQLMAGLMYLGSGLGLAVLRLSAPASGAEAGLQRRDLPWLAGATLFGGLIGPVLLLFGLQSCPATNASLLLNLEGVLTALLAWFVFHENVDRRVAAGMALIVAGSLVLSWQGAVVWGGLTGSLLVACACLCWAIDNNLTQKVSASDPKLVAGIKGLAAGSVNLMVALGAGAHLPAAKTMAIILAIGFVGYGLSLMLFVLALRTLGTARTGAYFSLAPFVGAGLSIGLLGEPVTGALALATGLMGWGLWLHLSERHSHEHEHEPLEHTHRHVHDEHHQHEHGPDDPPGEPHSHAHRHGRLIHAHPHFPDLHHRHRH